MLPLLKVDRLVRTLFEDNETLIKRGEIRFFSGGKSRIKSMGRFLSKRKALLFPRKSWQNKCSRINNQDLTERLYPT